MALAFYKCKKCGNMIAFLEKSACDVVCCGEPMVEMKAGTSDGAHEKHVPVVEKNGDEIIVTVGSVEHPMLEEHFIQWIAIETKQGAQRKRLSPGEAPKATFKLAGGDEFVAAYEYCNLHGLWKSE